MRKHLRWAVLSVVVSIVFVAGCKTSKLGGEGGVVAADEPRPARVVETDSKPALASAPVVTPPAPGADPAHAASGEAPEAEKLGPPGGIKPGRLIDVDEVTDDAALLKTIRRLTEANQAKLVMEELFQDKARSIPALRKAMRVHDTNVRIQAALILARCGEASPETTDAFRDALLHDREPEVRASVARALTHYSAPELVQPLITVLEKDGFPTAQANAAWALGAQGSKKAVPALVGGLGSPETWVRLRSVNAIRRLRAREALPAILERLKDSNAMVRERAHKTLTHLTGKSYKIDAYDKWSRVVKRKR